MHRTELEFRLVILGALGLMACTTDPVVGDDDTGDDGTESSSTESGDTASGDTASSNPETGDPDSADPELCEDPVPIMQLGTETPSGFVMCGDGFIHREEPISCVNPHTPGSCAFGIEEFGCMTDADCVDAPNGACNNDIAAGNGCQCEYGCESDADCDEGDLCACPGVVGERSQCIPADCPQDDACAGGLCGLERWSDVCNQAKGQTACTSADSTCRFDEQCELACEGSELLRCMASKGWNCQTADEVLCGEYCGEGRPFIVEEEARLAVACQHPAWHAGRELESLPHAELAAHWTRVGLFEHASVASFARFAAQLLALGAPPTLLRATQRAAADEVEHAQLAFALASRYAGHPVGPGALPITGALAAGFEPNTIVRALIQEACVGETLAAIEAHHAAGLARDPQVRAALERIAADELRHAELGWSSLRWMLARPGAPSFEFAVRCLSEALVELRRAATHRLAGPDDEGVESHGLLGSRRRAQLRLAAIDRVLEPCVQALGAATQRLRPV